MDKDLYNQHIYKILSNIFHHLSQTDLLSCQKVCKAWYLAAQPLYWKNIQLKTEKHLNLFIKDIDSIPTQYIKTIEIGDNSRAYSDEFELKKEQLKQLRLAHVKEIKLSYPFAYDLVEFNDIEFLNEFYKHCPKIKSFQVKSTIIAKSTQQKEYMDILYTFRQTLKKIIMGIEYRDIAKVISSFPCLQDLDISCNRHINTFTKCLPIIKALSQLKSIKFRMEGEDSHFASKEDDHFNEKLNKQYTLIKQLGALEKLCLIIEGWPLRTYTDIITQYFIGLKEIEMENTIYSSLNKKFGPIYNELLKFICDREKYKIKTAVFDASQIDNFDAFYISLQNNFSHLPTSIKNVQKHLIMELSGINEAWFDDDEVSHGDYFGMEIKSTKYDNQILRLAELYFACCEIYSDVIFDIFNSTFSVVKDIDTLTLKIFSIPEHFPFNTFKFVGDLLSLTTNSLKKVILNVDSNCCWSKYFIKYEKIKQYRQVTHLEMVIGARSGIPMDDFTVTQFIVTFPNVKYLTIQYFNGIWIPKDDEYFVNLPQVSLNRLTLDITTIISQVQEIAQNHNSFISSSHFVLKIEISHLSYYYQVEFDNLNTKKLTKFEEIDTSAHLLVNIKLKDIRCLEMRYMKHPYSKQGPQKTTECRVYLE